MIRFFITFLASWAISGWILSEVLYFAPFSKPIVEKIQQAITIPRHDEWNLDRFPLELNSLLVKLKASPAVHKIPFYYFDSILDQQETFNVADELSPLVWDDFSGYSYSFGIL